MRMEEGRSNLRFYPLSERRRRNYWMNEQKCEEKRLVDEDEKKEEEKKEMRTREKGDWMGNESRMKQFLNFVDSSEDRARPIKADRSKEVKRKKEGAQGDSLISVINK